MARTSFKASAPGKLMLLGEHAVLHGSRCIVCAVNQRMNVEVTPRNDRRLTIDSALGQLTTDLDALQIDQTFRFILTTVKTFPQPLPGGFDLVVRSDFTSTVGLGSSAAVTAAMTAALFRLVGLPLDPHQIFDHSLKTVRTVQGAGSGADLAASVFGGMLLYRAQPLEIRPLAHIYPLAVVYSGAKTPTTQVIERVEEKRKRFPGLLQKIYAAMDESAGMAAQAISEQDWPRFGELLNLNQGLMDALGVSSRALADIAYALRERPGILGSKISGSGLGDCVVGLGPAGELEYDLLPLTMSREGVRID